MFNEFMNDGRMPNPRRDFMAAYDSEIRQLDGKVQGLFEQFHWETNTIVIVTSDHGEGFHDHGLVGHANSLYNELLRVPLLVYSSAEAYPAARIAVPVAHVDVLPTLREIAGLPPDAQNVGWSLLPLLRAGRWSHGERPLLAHLMEFDEQHQWKSVVLGKWKLIDRIPGRPELYDLEADWGEQHDVSAQHPAEVARLRDAYARTEASAPRFTDAARNEQLSPEAIEKLKALGYVQ
jgi:arylsulfatase A-like enzyme